MAEITYRQYTGESDLPHIMALVQRELSEPYVIYTYRYFLHQWPHLSFLAYSPRSSDPVGVIVCKQSMHRDTRNRGYIAMLSVHRDWRKRGIASTLVRRSIDIMKKDGVEEVVLETEFDNSAALSLYESLGFIREKRLYRFYLNGKDAFRLVLVIPSLPFSSSDEEHGQTKTVKLDPLGFDVELKKSELVQPRIQRFVLSSLPVHTFEISGQDYDSDDEVSSR